MRYSKRSAWICAVLGLLAAAGGCATLNAPEAQIAASNTRFNSVTIRYQCDSRFAPRPAVSPSGAGEQVSYQQPASASPTGAGTISTLLVKYPHPQGHQGFARVELIVEDAPRGEGALQGDEANKSTFSRWLDPVRRLTRDNLPGVKYADGVKQAWGLDVPSGDIDRVVDRLNQQGFFAPGSDASRGVMLEARIDRLSAAKGWRNQPELDALATRVRREGSLVSQTRRLDRQWANGPGLQSPNDYLIMLPGGVSVPSGVARPKVTRLPPVN